MLRRNGALSFEANGRAVTFDGDFERMDVTMLVRSGKVAKAVMSFQMSADEVLRLYEFLEVQRRRKLAREKKAETVTSDDKVRRLMEGYRCAT